MASPWQSPVLDLGHLAGTTVLLQLLIPTPQLTFSPGSPISPGCPCKTKPKYLPALLPSLSLCQGWLSLVCHLVQSSRTNVRNPPEFSAFPGENPGCPLHQHVPSFLLQISETQATKALLLPFLLCLHGLLELLFLPGKQQTDPSIASMRNFSFPLWAMWVLPSFLHHLLANRSGGPPPFHRLLVDQGYPNQILTRSGLSLTPSLLSCTVEMHREMINCGTGARDER